MWPKVFFLMVCSILAVVRINDWSQAAKRKMAVTPKLLFGSVIFVVWSLLFIQLFVREAKFHHDLIRLRSATTIYPVSAVRLMDALFDWPGP